MMSNLSIETSSDDNSSCNFRKKKNEKNPTIETISDSSSQSGNIIVNAEPLPDYIKNFKSKLTFDLTDSI